MQRQMGFPNQTYSSYMSNNQQHSHLSQNNPNSRNNPVLWVGSLHPSTTQADLQREFERFGQIQSINVLPNKQCAFVKFAYPHNAQTAFSAMQRHLIHNQPIKLGWGKGEEQLPPSLAAAFQGAMPGFVGGGNVSAITPHMAMKELPPEPPSRTIWVGHVQSYFTEGMLINVFQRYGTILNVKILQKKVCFFLIVFICFL